MAEGRKAPSIETLVTNYQTNLSTQKENKTTGWSMSDNNVLFNRVTEGIDRISSIYRVSDDKDTTDIYKIRETLYGDLTPEDKFKDIKVEEGTVYFYILPETFTADDKEEKPEEEKPEEGTTT